LIPERAAFWVADILADPEARIPAFGAYGPLDLPFPVAAKTGTSSDFRDAWTVGFDRRYVVGVWIGNLDGEPLARLSGARVAAPLFREAWYALHAWEAARSSVKGEQAMLDRPAVLDPPAELKRRPICSLSGLAPGAACTEVVREWLPADSPLVPCHLHRRAGGEIETVLPAEYEPWLRRTGWQATIDGSIEGGEDAAAEDPDSHRARAGFRIESPRDGERFFLAHDLPADVQTIALRAIGPAPGAVLTWEVDGVTAGNGTEVRWALRPGAHQIVARAGASCSAPVRIEVLESAAP
jgi:penicillin-binding protein 1C